MKTSLIAISVSFALLNMSGIAQAAGDIDAGQESSASCASCHGVDGKGMEYVAPSLSSLVVDVLNHGKKGDIGDMPAFKNFNNIQKKALNSYIYSLNN